MIQLPKHLPSWEYIPGVEGKFGGVELYLPLTLHQYCLNYFKVGLVMFDLIICVCGQFRELWNFCRLLKVMQGLRFVKCYLHYESFRTDHWTAIAAHTPEI